MTKILVCGDSFCVTDSEFPDLHWTEKLLNFSPNVELHNMAYGGSSNAMIVMQLLHGLSINPDFVIFSFTSNGRYEYDRDATSIPMSLSSIDLADFQKSRYTTNMYNDKAKNSVTDRFRIDAASNSFEKLKNYFNICFCLELLQNRNIPYCYSLGGFEFDENYPNLLNSNYLPNLLLECRDSELKTNLWYHRVTDEKPVFHVPSDAVQTLFTNECISQVERQVGSLQ